MTSALPRPSCAGSAGVTHLRYIRYRYLEKHMVQHPNEQLAAEIAELKAANAELTHALTHEQARNRRAGAGQGPGKSPRSRPWGLALLSTTLIVIGALLAPVAVVSTWAHRELTDTDYFVATFAPRAEEPAVQDFVAVQAVDAIETQLDIDQIANDLFEGLDGLDIRPRGKEALALLRAPAVSGVKGLITSTVTGFVQSEAFATIWDEALTITHQQGVSTATGQRDAAVTIGTNQQISVQLGPIIQAVKEQLVADGFTLADRIPVINRSIVIAEDSSIGIYLTIYQIVVAVGVWLPWIMLIVLATGVLMARRRTVALAWASGSVLFTMLLADNGITAGKDVFALAAASVIPHDAAVVLNDGTLDSVTDMIVALGVLAATVLTVTLLLGPWQWARTLRRFGAHTIASIRRTAERHGLTTGAFGVLLHRWRKPLRLLVGALWAICILFIRPITPGMIVWTASLSIGTIFVLELLSRPPPSTHSPNQPLNPQH